MVSESCFLLYRASQGKEWGALEMSILVIIFFFPKPLGSTLSSATYQVVP